jgi:deoxyribodipyrimidine photo-lyase
VDITFQRDIAMADYFKAEGIGWQEFPANAVQRGLKDRDGWRADWKRIINQPLAKVDLKACEHAQLSKACREWLQARTIPARFKNTDMQFQVGGEANAWNTADDFIYGRSRHYNDAISAPGPAQVGCSRLSPYITWGNVSIRQLWQYVKKRYDRLAWKRPVRSFRSRLRWHCHFIQKFESEPRMEFQNLNRGYDDIRCKVDYSKVDAWKEGQTGIPMVDACMRSVKTTGYLNFRMRAMLVSFLTHHLWQPWQAGAAFLGRQFLDFEPGIHYPQFQMQAATIGVNSIRIYNPVKQGYDHDAEGHFIRRWVPELRDIPPQFVHEPWKLSAMERQMYGYEPGATYPAPIIPDIKQSYHKASEILWAKKEEISVRKENERIVKKHVKNRR